MGSFTGTCAVSNLPIEDGDDVRFFLLTECPFKDSIVCTMDGVWIPRTYPLKCKYNDYGGVKNVPEGDERDVWLEALAHDAVEFDNDSSWDHTLQKIRRREFLVRNGIKSFESIDHDRLMVHVTALLGDEVKREVVESPTYGAKELLLATSMIREDVWQALLRVPIAGSKLSIKTFYDAIEASNEKPLARKSNSFDAPLDCIAGRDMFVLGLGTHWYLMCRKGRLPDSFLRTAAEFAYVHSVLSMTRYYWRPDYSVGTQFPEWGMHKKVTAAIAEVASKRRR